MWQVGLRYQDCRSRNGVQVGLLVVVVKLVVGPVVEPVVELVVEHPLITSFAALRPRYHT